MQDVCANLRAFVAARSDGFDRPYVLGMRKLRFGTAREVKEGAPEFGRRYPAGPVVIGHNQMEPYEINFRAQQDVVSIPLGVIEGVRAYNSDKLHKLAVQPGDLIFHPSGATVYVDAPRRVAEFLTFAIDPALRQEIEEESGAKGLPVDEPHSRTLRGSAVAVGIAQMARRFMLGGHPGGRLAAQSFAILALAEALSAPAGAMPRPPNAFAMHSLRRVLDYIEVKRGSDIALIDLAQVAGLTTYHFARAFKQATGITPARYVMERRLALARELLAGTGVSLAGVAHDAGFASQSHMTDSFRRLLGTTPGRYRREMRA